MTLLKKIIYKNYLIFFLNSILCSFVINSILDNNLQLNFFYKNYIAGLPVKFSYILGFYFLTLKIFVVSFLVLSILIYIKKKIKFYIAKDNTYFLKVFNYLLLLSNISYIANIFSNNIFEGPVIDKVVNFTYLHFFIFSIIYFVHFKYKFFKINIKDDFFYLKFYFQYPYYLYFNIYLEFFFKIILFGKVVDKFLIKNF